MKYLWDLNAETRGQEVQNDGGHYSCSSHTPQGMVEGQESSPSSTPRRSPPARHGGGPTGDRAMRNSNRSRVRKLSWAWEGPKSRTASHQLDGYYAGAELLWTSDPQVAKMWTLLQKLKSETRIGDAHKADHLWYGKMRRGCITEEQNWLSEG
jgi:hypothetical protein